MQQRAIPVRIRVLIASDYRLTRTGLRRLLATVSDFEVVGEVESIAEVAESYQQLSPDVVLLDIMVPGPHGLRVIARLLQQAPDPRVVVLTTNENVSYARAVLSTGVLGYVLRKASEVELFTALRTAARGRRFIDPRVNEAVAGVILAVNKRQAPRDHRSLSNREREVLRAIAQGFTSQEIAREMSLSAKTIDTYRARIYNKLGMHSRSDLVQYALATGLLADTESA